jgi:hypothetical protein
MYMSTSSGLVGFGRRVSHGDSEADAMEESESEDDGGGVLEGYEERSGNEGGIIWVCMSMRRRRWFVQQLPILMLAVSYYDYDGCMSC